MSTTPTNTTSFSFFDKAIDEALAAGFRNGITTSPARVRSGAAYDEGIVAADVKATQDAALQTLAGIKFCSGEITACAAPKNAPTGFIDTLVSMLSAERKADAVIVKAPRER